MTAISNLLYQTPGTRLTWSTLAEWIQVARILAERRCSAKRYSDIDTHWHVLPENLIDEAPLETLAIFISFLQSPNNIAWGKPERGQRRGTKWERLNVSARNRRTRLIRAEDLENMAIGHNSKNASKSSSQGEC